jgi:hypothetical protein
MRQARPGFAHLRAAYRSGLEATVAALLATSAPGTTFESHRVPFTEPAKNRHYTPDFVLPNGIVIETKGIFDAADRAKHLLVREQHPDLDIRIVFSNPNARISKGSPTTYAIWCGKNAFKFARKEVPKEWVDEPAESVRLAAVAPFRKK